jgi:HPt (histidine-containing phosphotransfer) domain-containing protein
MPEMDGIVTVQEIRKLGGKYENVVIIALTANAVAGAREMFLANGFNDFISKPIEAGELQKVVQRYLPDDIVQIVNVGENSQAASDKEGQLRRKSIHTFVKDNKDTFEMIRNALDSSDYKTAHRIAHTLKSSAGYLGEKDLQEAAYSLELSLQGEPPGYAPEQIITFEKELSTVLRNLEPVAKEMDAERESEKSEAVQIGDDEIAAIFAELKPLLINNDFKAVQFIERLQGIRGMGELIERIEDYDFNGALMVLKGVNT